MATGPGFPGFTNVFVPSTNAEADGRIIIGFSRNPSRFPIAKYCQYTKVSAPVFYYLKLTAQEAARVVNVADYVWPDGENRPSRPRDTESFNFIPSRTERYDYGFEMGQKTVDFASWPIVEQHSQIHAAKCVTARTIRLWTELTTAANWGTAADPDLSTNHTSATATILGAGGSLYAGTSTDPRLKKALDIIAVQVSLDTLGVAGDKTTDFCAVFNPVTARKLAESAEVHDYMKGSPFSQPVLYSGDDPAAKFGLPSKYYGYNMVVEDTVRVSTRVGATLSRTWVVPDNALVFMSRVGGLDGVYGAPSFSTVTFFYLEEMTIERFNDPKNRRMEGHVVEDGDEILTCPASGWYVADISA